MLAEKILKLRVFDGEQGKMNRSIVDCGGAILVISQFTLFGDWRKGNPSFSTATPAETAERLYRYFVERLRAGGVIVSTFLVYRYALNMQGRPMERRLWSTTH